MRALRKQGFVDAGGTKHRKFIKTENGQTFSTVIPFNKFIKRKTVDDIRKQCGMSKEVFYSLDF